MFTENQMETMLELQNKINEKVNPSWIKEDNDWMLAVMMESAEAIDHHGYKWWKHQEADLAQLQMELVDIWHFILSRMIVSNRINVSLSDSFNFDGEFYYPQENSIIQNLKLMTGLASVNRYDLDLFYQIMKQAHLPHDDLFKQYVGKNVLNMFRQDNGYKNGTYIKVWFDGREDNEHLTDLLDSVDINSKNVDADIYKLLLLYYSKNK